MKISLSICLAVPALAVVCFAAETKNWIQGDQTDFEKANLKKVSLRSDGVLTLAPEFKELFDASVSYLWAVAQDSKGNLYVGGGGTGGSQTKLFVVSPDGTGRALAELDGLEIHAVVVDRRDQIFAATAPDGKVYRIVSGKAETFYDPKAKYIWAMAFNSKGELLVATGDRGEIHCVAPDGKGSVLFKSEDANIRSMTVDAKDNIIVGTEPGGLLLRISPSGEGFVLHQTAKREVTAVAVAKSGVIYAASVGIRQPSSPTAAPPAVQIGTPPGAQPATGQQAPVGAPRPSPTIPPSVVTSIPSVAGGSDVFQIDSDGYPRKVWTHPQEIVYAIGFDAEDRPLLGTGNKGNVYRLDSPVVHTLMLNASPTQITGFLSGGQKQTYAIAGNLGKVYQIGPGLEREGTVESDVLDASSFTYWGRLSVRGTPGQGRYSIQTRSGNLDRPQQNWSNWAPVILADGAGRVTSPPARFLQWKLTLTHSGSGQLPEVRSVETAYQAKNVAPVVQKVEITPPNYRFPTPSAASAAASPATLTLPALGGRGRGATPALTLDTGSTATLQYAKNHIGVRWLASDENGDELVFKVEIRGVGESEWRLLKDQVREKHLSWDTTAFPDGQYRLRITASDAPDNTPAQTLTAQIESETFVIDNTPPQVTGLTATRNSSQVQVRWKAKDALNVIRKAEYSVDGGDWVVAEPVTRLSDSPEHDYTLTIDGLPAGEHTIAVRVTDSYDNQAVEKAVLR